MRANATTSDQRSAAFNNIFGNAPPPGRTPGVQSRSGHLPGQRPQRPSLPPGYNNFSYVNSLNHPPQQLRPPPLTNQHYYPDSQYLAHHYQQRPLPQQRPPQLPFNGSDGYRNPPPIRVHDHPSAPSSYTAPQYDSNQNQFPQRSYPPPAYSSRSISSGDPPTAPALNSDSYRTRSLQSAPPPNRNISATSSLSQTPQERSHSFSSASDSRSDSMSRAPPKRQFSTATTTSNLSGISEVDRTYSISSIASTNTATVQSRQKRPAVTYPALLSLVSEAFRNRLFLSDKQKDGLTYKAAFSGSEAVDMIMHLIKTTDRNLALLLGRSLDAQKFFHDVTYEHRLRDRANEIYQFRERLNSPSFENPSDLADLISSPSPRVSGDMDDFPNGVFTLLTECYSPTCTRDRLCYSIACPRRLEQQARLNLKPTGLKRADSRASLKEDEGEQKLWIHSVPKEIAELTSDKEKKRQEVICEVSYTERDFVKDLEYLRDVSFSSIQSPRLNISPWTVPLCFTDVEIVLDKTSSNPIYHL
ncbi:Rho1 guanine nucleotide exchange factor 1 [Neolecta irregularis DAH-3]|uniref:Rho1 guanine nucleotide exchange factor 1 n=1 Tax=Neolecta irregularis (strain DAH-3) TaxID=1198029 RepID=A0A1U7LQ70_NEOID|nr:Rho1 guanine nucleotide exchange factor 1 [Neolecta irregularis DAH-3]|eukprot:OLL24820.1 Rho1 guanine nucleotide exchange factor 1 [Neolecta irregularis DAH-3]